jgi:hypothetical protein
LCESHRQRDSNQDDYYQVRDLNSQKQTNRELKP